MTRIILAGLLMVIAGGALSQMAQVQTPEQRISAVIGQIIIDNAKLGHEVEQLRLDIAHERARADAAERRVKELEAARRPEGEGP
jgi:hypothetical protein